MEKKLLQRIEGMEDGEREKLRELLKDSKQPEEGRLAWMYKDKVDSEEYLMGRRIDSSSLNDPEPTTDDTPGALFNEVITRRSEMDMQVKMREDPLYAIRKKEEEVRRRLLENPIKMKQLQKTIEEQKAQKKHEHKKKKKKKKHKKSDSSSDDDDDDLLRQYLSIVDRKKCAEMPSQKQERRASPGIVEDKLRQSSDGSLRAKHQRPTSSNDGVGDKTRHAHRRSPDDKITRPDSTHQQKMNRGSISVDDTKRKRSRRDNFERGKSTRDNSDCLWDHPDKDRTVHKRRRSADSDGGTSRDGHHSRSKRRPKDMHRRRRSSEAEKETTESVCRTRHRSSSGDERPDSSRGNVAGYGLIMSSRVAAAAAHRSKTQTAAQPASETSMKADAQPVHKPSKRKLTEEEMAAKRAEMMANAQNRDEQRARNVKRYREDDERDRLRAEKSSTAAASFVQPMMAQHASESSVEDRIKRNVYNIQRTSAQLDRNFARH